MGHLLSRRTLFIALGALMLLAVIITLTAPQEQTLGDGIKSVYVHVSLIWTGSMLLMAAGILGALASAFKQPRLLNWTQHTGWIALVFFAAGLSMSLLAAYINWGGIFIDEPRFLTSSRILAAGVIVSTLSALLPDFRLKGVMHTGIALFMLLTIRSARLILHPENPITSSDSSGIQMTFLLLFLVNIVAASLIITYWNHQQTGTSHTVTGTQAA